MEEKKGTQLNLLDEIKPVASNSEVISLDEFHMKPSTIGFIEVQESNKGYIDGKWVENLPVPMKQLYVESVPLKTVKNKQGEDVIYTAREWFNLIQLKDGKLGWSTHEKGKLNNFLKAVKCTNLKDLIGKPIIVKVADRDNKDGTKTQLLRFMY